TAISHASGQDINGAMSSFLDQPGVPYVTVEPKRPNFVEIRQQRFKSDGDMEDVDQEPTEEKMEGEQHWKIPVILAVPDGKGTKTIRTWLTEEDTTLVMPGPTGPTWVLPNAGSSGYYVWNVPGVWLEAIAKDHARLTPAERIGFLRNLILLQRAGVVPPEDYMRLLHEFKDDPEPEVVLAVVAAVEAIREPL